MSPATTNSNFQTDSIDWEDLYFDLKNERAIMILGPDFHQKNNLSIREQLYYELIKREDHGILHFYPSNGIFLFQSEKYKNKAQKGAVQFYKTLDANQDILQKITELPFRMIINTNPDKILEANYNRRDIACQFYYFTSKPCKKEKELSEPNYYFPLIFNLFGSIDTYESLVLDFEDIFDHLKALLNDNNVSPVIRSVLNETDTYIFIGFHLEKWDTQLLFRYLNMKDHGFDDSKKNYTTRSVNIDTNAELFFRQQFNLKYYGAPTDFLNEMYERYFELSTKEDQHLINSLSPVKVIDQFISSDEIEKSLNYLTVRLSYDRQLLDDLIIIKSNYSRYKFREDKRLDNFETLQIERNRIKLSIIEISKTLQ